MKSSAFSIQRFGLLIRQNTIHNSRLYLISLASVSGGLFILLFIGNLTGGFNDRESLSGLFAVSFLACGILYSSSSFTGFRSKEGSVSYLMIPASPLEKFTVEFLSRIIFLILLFPVLFFIVYNIEGPIAGQLIPDFTFQRQSLFTFPGTNVDQELRNLIGALVTSSVFLIFIIPFLGSTVFMKHPLVKTLFSLAIIFLAFLALFYLMIEVFNWKEYSINEADLFLVPDDSESVIRFFAIATLIGNLFLLTTAFFKLKEKEA